LKKAEETTKKKFCCNQCDEENKVNDLLTKVGQNKLKIGKSIGKGNFGKQNE